MCTLNLNVVRVNIPLGHRDLPDVSRLHKHVLGPVVQKKSQSRAHRNSKDRRASEGNQSKFNGCGSATTSFRKDSTADFGGEGIQMPDTDIRSDRSQPEETCNFDIDATFGAGPPKTAFDETFGNAQPKGTVFVTQAAPMAPNLGIKLSFGDMAQKHEEYSKVEEERKQSEHIAFLERLRMDNELKAQEVQRANDKKAARALQAEQERLRAEKEMAAAEHRKKQTYDPLQFQQANQQYLQGEQQRAAAAVAQAQMEREWQAQWQAYRQQQCAYSQQNIQHAQMHRHHAHPFGQEHSQQHDHQFSSSSISRTAGQEPVFGGDCITTRAEQEQRSIWSQWIIGDGKYFHSVNC